ncbi:MAG: hypothetical protein CYPHOPRED_001675 [Cyphobasidiales sp. Tagirdzhanova-0007]|nr:MAG: hypothetical protein CYPHOPRED_001675 [Cyphobasidiales sp. Tagirdzhanova-0007]
MPRRAAVANDVESTSESLAILAEYRRKGVRHSVDIVKRGERVLQEKGALKRMGEEVWPFLEQLGFAAVDTGKNDLASRLQDKFPASPRVDALHGLILETESKEKARVFYEKKLAEDENNLSTMTRKHALSQLQQSLSCISDLILLEPTNTFHVLRHAETCYTLGDYATAYRGFCRALEMGGRMNEGGLGRRAGMGVKLCLQRMTDPSGGVNTSKKDVARAANSETEVGVQGPRKGNDIDALVTQEILFAYGISWNAVGDRVAGHEENKAVKAWLEKQNSATRAVAAR